MPPKPRKPAADPKAEKTAEQVAQRANLVAEAQSNPFAFFTAKETRIIFGFGPDTMTTLRALGAPIVARQMHPGLLLKWIEINADKIPKIRQDEEEE